jgi:hypothetical protein
MRAAPVFLLGILAGAGGMALVNYVAQRTEATQAAAVPAARATQPPTDRTQPRVSTQTPPAATPAATIEHSFASEELGARPEIFEPRTSSEWNALVGGMLEWQVEHRMGVRLSAAQRDRLVSELARLREASLALQEAPANPGDPAELRERLARTLTLAQVDEAFREELGIGVAEFVRQLDPDAVRDVSHRPQP